MKLVVVSTQLSLFMILITGKNINDTLKMDMKEDWIAHLYRFPMETFLIFVF